MLFSRNGPLAFGGKGVCIIIVRIFISVIYSSFKVPTEESVIVTVKGTRFVCLLGPPVLLHINQTILCCVRSWPFFNLFSAFLLLMPEQPGVTPRVLYVFQ